MIQSKQQLDLQNNQDATMETASMPKEIKTKPKKRIRKPFLILLILILIAGVSYGGYKYYNYSKTEVYKQKKADRQVKSLVNKVGKLILLPEGTPAIFDIKDPMTLIPQQAFFVGSEKGDQLLVYPQIGKAIIYSPKRNLIVNVGPVTNDEQPAPVTDNSDTNTDKKPKTE